MTIDEVYDRLEIDEIPDQRARTNMEHKLRSIEVAIRQITNNKFHDRKVMAYGQMTITAKRIQSSAFLNSRFKVGDTIEILESSNDGLYTIASIEPTAITVNESIDDVTEYALILKVVYPADVIDGVVQILRYDLKMQDKAGIKSESYSRYSVTYADLNGSAEGRPTHLLKFMDKYRKMRWS